MLLSTNAELQMHFVELGEHMDDPGNLQPEGEGAENGADAAGRRADICSKVTLFNEVTV